MIVLFVRPSISKSEPYREDSAPFANKIIFWSVFLIEIS